MTAFSRKIKRCSRLYFSWIPLCNKVNTKEASVVQWLLYLPSKQGTRVQFPPLAYLTGSSQNIVAYALYFAGQAVDGSSILPARTEYQFWRFFGTQTVLFSSFLRVLTWPLFAYREGEFFFSLSLSKTENQMVFSVFYRGSNKKVVIDIFISYFFKIYL